MRHFIIFSLTTLLLVGCAHTTSSHYTQTVQSWRGGNAKTLLKTWGRPDSVSMAQNGDTVYFYNTRSYSNYASQVSPMNRMRTNSNGQLSMTNSTANTTSPWNRGTMSMHCTAAFIVNKQGKIADIQTKGTACYGSETFAKRLKNPQG